MTSTVITVGRILSGDSDAEPIDDGALVVDTDSGLIRSVGHRSALLDSATTPDYRFPEATALPGLINGHVHLSFDEDRLDPVDLADVSPEDLLESMYEAAASMLRRGVTTLRDTGDRLGAAGKLRARHDPTHGEDRRPIPRLLVAGPPLTPVHGHCWFLGGTVELEPKALTAHIDALAQTGVDWIKVMVSGGHITEGGAGSWESQFNRSQLGTIVAAAQSHGLPVAAHAHGVTAIGDAVDAGVATIEHCSMLTSSDLVPNFDPAIAEAIRAAGVFVCQADNHDYHMLASVLPERAVGGWIGRARWLADHGVTLFCGTDAGVLPFDSTTKSLINHANQFNPTEILRMATADAARALRIENQIGRLLPGLSADILIVNGDPSVNIDMLTNVEAVFARGRLVM